MVQHAIGGDGISESTPELICSGSNARKRLKREFDNFASYDSDRPPCQFITPLATSVEPVVGSELKTCFEAHFSFGNFLTASSSASSASRTSIVHPRVSCKSLGTAFRRSTLPFAASVLQSHTCTYRTFSAVHTCSFRWDSVRQGKYDSSWLWFVGISVAREKV